ncbi:mitochondrial 54S ribosomal protein mL44 [Aspergillus fumigatus Af293]|uniref:Large ribosomal subunit protein mL44 n=2 Tax=Aspergillus fumigatus TaxID=746128 RepID=Q4WSH7_ASPFU|nr:60S ribosomal protein L3 [Aspergillus fumigatus Af293]EAL90605.1 60S ribosomal protein L3 [Aspergillus fumigatus Af293]EDP56509.1 60S ribosomal protein L3 [Aspergillus fumigatus A1163]KEY81375.1 60S ribosomal protein L3 [Aspergillus fumigatus]
MKRLQLLRWSSSVRSPRPRTNSRLHQRVCASLRYQSTSSPVTQAEEHQSIEEQSLRSPIPPSNSRQSRYLLPSPPVEAARESAKLAALHARLYLPSRLPLETLARALVDASADPNPDFNNESLATLGHDLLTNYTSEHLICTYPRLPLTVIFAAMYAYVGPKTLSAMAREWGVEMASITSRVVYDNEFGDPVKEVADSAAQAVSETHGAQGVTAEQASATFVRAVMGAIYLHAGRPAAKRFFEQHILSRHLNISELFNFSQPARDLTRLCARENFERPVAKIISETGRKSRHPVFVVGIYSGQDKLGEGAGASLMEARSRAAVAALKGWYLYSPLNVRVPSSMEEEGAAPWKPVYVDLGEVIV